MQYLPNLVDTVNLFATKSHTPFARFLPCPPNLVHKNPLATKMPCSPLPFMPCPPNFVHFCYWGGVGGEGVGGGGVWGAGARVCPHPLGTSKRMPLWIAPDFFLLSCSLPPTSPPRVTVGSTWWTFHPSSVPAQFKSLVKSQQGHSFGPISPSCGLSSSFFPVNVFLVFGLFFTFHVGFKT